jgi:hypothetical protein
LLNTTQQVGGALGLAVLSTLATSRTNSVVNGIGHPASIVEKTAAQVDGYQLAFTAGAFSCSPPGSSCSGSFAVPTWRRSTPETWRPCRFSSTREPTKVWGQTP